MRAGVASLVSVYDWILLGCCPGLPHAVLKHDESGSQLFMMDPVDGVRIIHSDGIRSHMRTWLRPMRHLGVGPTCVSHSGNHEKVWAQEPFSLKNKRVEDMKASNLVDETGLEHQRWLQPTANFLKATAFILLRTSKQTPPSWEGFGKSKPLASSTCRSLSAKIWINLSPAQVTDLCKCSYKVPQCQRTLQQGKCKACSVRASD